MNISEKLKSYPEFERIIGESKSLNSIIENSESLINSQNLKTIFSLIDLTTLDVCDTHAKVISMCKKVNEFNKAFPTYPNVAAICVYPALVPVVKENLKIEKVNIASVVGGFPASQTFIDIKTAEAKMAVDTGANETDMVISVGKLLEGKVQEVYDEIVKIRMAIGDAHLKVILETGALTPELIYKASIIAMEAGADFIKTSTGKFNPAATNEAIYIMSIAIKLFHSKTSRQTGIKPAGGISTSTDAIQAFAIVKDILGQDWLNPKLFRIGASRLANNLLAEIAVIEDVEYKENYF